MYDSAAEWSDDETDSTVKHERLKEDPALSSQIKHVPQGKKEPGSTKLVPEYEPTAESNPTKMTNCDKSKEVKDIPKKEAEGVGTDEDTGEIDNLIRELLIRGGPENERTDEDTGEIDNLIRGTAN